MPDGPRLAPWNGRRLKQRVAADERRILVWEHILGLTRFGVYATDPFESEGNPAPVDFELRRVTRLNDGTCQRRLLSCQRQWSMTRAKNKRHLSHQKVSDFCERVLATRGGTNLANATT